MASTKVSIYIRLGVITRLCFCWRSGKLVCFSQEVACLTPPCSPFLCLCYITRVMASTKVSIYIRLGVITRLCFCWHSGKLVCFSQEVACLTPPCSPFLCLCYIFTILCKKNGPRWELNKHTLLCNQSKSTSEPVNNFDIFYKQLNIYFTNVWHPQENNSRSAIAHTFFVSLQEI